MADATRSIIGPQIAVQGTVSGGEDLVVEGRLDGQIRIDGALTVEAGGVVEASVEAAEVAVGGALRGDVAAGGTVTLRGGAQVRGDVRCGAIVIEDGATFEGGVEMDVDLPADVTA